MNNCVINNKAAKRVLQKHEEASALRWFALFVYCSDMENGGVIKGCKGWTLKEWKSEIGKRIPQEDAAELWHWEGDDLVVEGYNIEAEKTYKQKVARGKNHARWLQERKNRKHEKQEKDKEKQETNKEREIREAREEKRDKERRIEQAGDNLLGADSPELQELFDSCKAK